MSGSEPAAHYFSCKFVLWQSNNAVNAAQNLAVLTL